LVADQYNEAGLNEPALGYWQQAGRRALERSAHAEAINHLTRGLMLLKSLAITPEQRQSELDFLTTLGPALVAIRGQAAPEVAQTYARARALCQQMGETPQLFLVLYGLCWFYFMQAEFQTAQELSEQLLAIGQRTHDPALLLPARRALGMTLL